MRLTHVRVNGFQSYWAPTTVALEPDLTLLAGRNNVGKSALLRALSLPVVMQPGTRDDFELELRWRGSAAEWSDALGTQGDGSHIAEALATKPEHTISVTYAWPQRFCILAALTYRSCVGGWRALLAKPPAGLRGSWAVRWARTP
jgi:predicted ATPase